MAALRLAASACALMLGTATSEVVQRLRIGGFYKDPNHYKAGTFAGTRMISDEKGDVPGNVITLIGSDDGSDFWTLQGVWRNLTSGDIEVNFAPKGGPANLQGKVADGHITWQDGGVWTRFETPDFGVDAEQEHRQDLGGFFTDPNHYKQGTFAGTRFVSDEVGSTPGNGLTLIGSDDGSGFWTLTGRFVQKEAGRLVVDFSPKGGPATLSGTFAAGAITWADGGKWTRAAVQAEVAALI